MSENPYSKKYEWLWPIIASLVVGAGTAWAVTESKTETNTQAINGLEERERSNIAIMATLAENQRQMAETQREMNAKLDKVLSRPAVRDR